MNNYELLYILPSNMTGKEIKNTFEDIEKEISKLGGEKLETLLDHPFLSKTETSKEEDSEELKNIPVVKRKLAYTINKNRFGFYCLFNFKSEGIKVKEIDTYLKMNKIVLRHFILQANPMSKEELARLQKLFARKKAEQEKESKQEKEAKAKEKEAKNNKKESKVEEKKEENKSAKIEKETKKEKVAETKEETVETKEEKKEEKAIEKEEGKETKKVNKKKIKLEELENKLDEILEDSVI